MELEKEILNELKSINSKLAESLELKKEEMKLQSEKNSNEAELALIADDERKQSELELQEEKVKAEERAVQLEQFIEHLEGKEEDTTSFQQNLLESLNALDQQESLTHLGNKLDVLIQSMEIPEETKVAEEFSHFTDLSLVTVIFAFIPAYLAYKGLSRLFDSAFA